MCLVFPRNIPPTGVVELLIANNSNAPLNSTILEAEIWVFEATNQTYQDIKDYLKWDRALGSIGYNGQFSQQQLSSSSKSINFPRGKESGLRVVVVVGGLQVLMAKS